MKKSTLRLWRTEIKNDSERISEFANHGLEADICFGENITGVRTIELMMFRQDYHYMGCARRQCQPEERISRRRLRLITRDEWTDGWYYAYICINGKEMFSTIIKLKEYEYLTCHEELKGKDDSIIMWTERQNTIEKLMGTEEPEEHINKEDYDEDNDKEEDVFEKAINDFVADASGCINLHIDTDKDGNSHMHGKDSKTEDATNTSSLTLPPSAVEQLEQMVGLKRMKKEMSDIRLMAMFCKERRRLGLERTKDSRHHMVFMGNPGTGKTTVARLVGKMFHDMGLLSSGHTIETERAKLMGEFIGQTEKNIRETIDRARGGVLFIDEAYTLINQANDSKDYGKEVINTLLTVLAEPDPDMIVILAGYEDKMKTLIEYNDGLKERFTQIIHFDDYTADELMEMARGVCDSANYRLTPDADARLQDMICKVTEKRDRCFGNGRWVHNIIHHHVIKHMARRVMTSSHHPTDRKLLCTVEECDVAEAEYTLLKKNEETRIRPLRIGFTA